MHALVTAVDLVGATYSVADEALLFWGGWQLTPANAGVR